MPVAGAAGTAVRSFQGPYRSAYHTAGKPQAKLQIGVHSSCNTSNSSGSSSSSIGDMSGVLKVPACVAPKGQTVSPTTDELAGLEGQQSVAGVAGDQGGATGKALVASPRMHREESAVIDLPAAACSGDSAAVVIGGVQQQGGSECRDEVIQDQQQPQPQPPSLAGEGSGKFPQFSLPVIVEEAAAQGSALDSAPHSAGATSMPADVTSPNCVPENDEAGSTSTPVPVIVPSAVRTGVCSPGCQGEEDQEEEAEEAMEGHAVYYSAGGLDASHFSALHATSGMGAGLSGAGAASRASSGASGPAVSDDESWATSMEGAAGFGG